MRDVPSPQALEAAVAYEELFTDAGRASLRVTTQQGTAPFPRAARHHRAACTHVRRAP